MFACANAPQVLPPGWLNATSSVAHSWCELVLLTCSESALMAFMLISGCSPSQSLGPPLAIPLAGPKGHLLLVSLRLCNTMAAAERPEPLRKKRSGGLGSMLRRPATVLSPQSTRAFTVTLCEAAAAPPQWVILRVSPVRAADQPAEKPFSCCMHVAYVRKGGPQGVLDTADENS